MAMRIMSPCLSTAETIAAMQTGKMESLPEASLIDFGTRSCAPFYHFNAKLTISNAKLIFLNPKFINLNGNRYLRTVRGRDAPVVVLAGPVDAVERLLLYFMRNSTFFNRKPGVLNRKSGFFNRKSGVFH